MCEKLTGGTQKFKNYSKEAYLGRIFDLGLRKGVTTLIWGYAEEYNFDLGLHKGVTTLIWGYAEEYNFDLGGMQVPKV